MLKLSKKTEYALIAASYMAAKQQKNFFTAKEIAEDNKLSFELVSKVLQTLVKNNIVVSLQGSKGGYFLNRNPLEISLLDLIKAVDPDYQLTNCLKDDASINDCSLIDSCKIRDPLFEVQKKIDEVFNSTKLSQII